MAKEERVIPAARWLDVMYEQTQYLIDHARMRERECPKGCGACRRLRDLERVLLQPFRKATRWRACIATTGAENETPVSKTHR